MVENKVINDNISRTIGKEALRHNIQAGTLLFEIIKTTLGPKGMDKMLVNSEGSSTITNDGVTILEKMQLDHPAAKMIADIARTQENEIGDGTTTVAMLAGKLLENAGKLIKKNIHPTIIVKGYSLASDKAMDILDDLAVKSTPEYLKSVAMTAMTGKSAENARDELSDIIVKAVDKVSSIEHIKVESVRGEVSSGELIEGIVLDKDIPNEAMPKKIINAKIALLDFGIETKNPEMDFQTQITSPEQLQSFKNSEQKTMKDIISSLTNIGTNVIFTNKGIDDYALGMLADEEIIGIRRVNKYDLELLSRSTGARIITDLTGVEEEWLGKAGVVEQIRNKNSSLIYVKDCENPEAVTILIHGSSDHVMNEMKRAITDGLGDVIASKNGKVVPGGGATEIELALKIKEFANTFSGREQLAIKEFASAIESIPETLAENAGLDPINIISALRSKHSKNKNLGLNLFKDEIEDTLKDGIIEPLKVKIQAIKSATQTANSLLRIDDILISK